MLDHSTQYEDLKIMFIGAGFITAHEEDCGYDEYVFAVRKKWLIDVLTARSEHPNRLVTDEELQQWLEEEYDSEDSWSIYLEAKDDGEVVFEGPVFNNYKTVYRQLYTVKEELCCDGEYESRVFLQTTEMEDAIERFEKEREAVRNEEDFFLKEWLSEDGNGEDRVRLNDGLPCFSVEDEMDGDYYFMSVQRTEFEDGRR